MCINANKINSVILDFSGTTVDPYVIAPNYIVEGFKIMEFLLVWTRLENQWD